MTSNRILVSNRLPQIHKHLLITENPLELVILRVYLISYMERSNYYFKNINYDTGAHRK